MINYISTFIEKLWDKNDLKKPIAVFFGSGISIASGNMDADETRKFILDLMFENSSIEKSEKKDILDAIFKQTGQFEDFLMRIYDDLNCDVLKDEYEKALKYMYKTPNPNKAHYFIAELANNKICNCFLTTNYDLHFEEQIGKEKINVVVYEEINKINKITKGESKPLYLKIHGSVNKENENNNLGIGIFLPQISSKYNTDIIDKALKHLFSKKNSQKKILFLGYSFSDVYDIVKWMKEKCRNIQNEIYVVSHNDSSCTLFETAEEYNNLKGKTTRNIPIFNNCLIFQGSTETFINEALDYLSIKNKYIKPNNFIESGEYKSNSKKELKDFFNEINNYLEYKNYYSILLRHQFLYEVARCCVVTDLKCNKSKKEETIVRKCHEYAMKEIDNILDLIEKLNIGKEDKEYRKCLNLRHKMILNLLSNNLEEGKKNYDYIIENMPKEYYDMRIRTIYDFVSNWYLNKIAIGIDGQLDNKYLEQLRNEKLNQPKKINSNKKIINYKCNINYMESATPTRNDIVTYNKSEFLPSEISSELVSLCNLQYLFVEGIFECQNNPNYLLSKLVEDFMNNGRPEYVAISYLIFGYLTKKNDDIEEAEKLFNNLGYTFGENNESYMEILCKKAKNKMAKNSN